MFTGDRQARRLRARPAAPVLDRPTTHLPALTR